MNLHWNKIKLRGGLKIADSLTKNTTLKVLDLSWNCLGKLPITFMGQMGLSEIKKKLKNQAMPNQKEAVDQISELER